MKNHFFAALLISTLAFGGAAQASTYVVNSNGDTSDAAPGDDFCGDSSDNCTLRAAIQEANAHSGADVINFNINTNIGGGGDLVGKRRDNSIRQNAVALNPCVITPATPLPALTETVTIDGYSQPNTSVNTLASGDNAVLCIELNGANAGANANGLTFDIGSDNSLVRGLVVNRFKNVGVLMLTAQNLQVAGCFIGTNLSGTVALGNKIGVSMISPVGGAVNQDTAGGNTPAERNLISGNQVAGVDAGGLISNNLIGTNAQGNGAVPNGLGVKVFSSAQASLITNVISGNTGAGIFTNTFGGVMLLSTNLIGTNAQGNAAVPNGVGVSLGQGTFNEITDNVISGNTGAGVDIASQSNGFFLRNFIGTNKAGTGALPNGGDGIHGVDVTPEAVIIGMEGGGNTIAFNVGSGISISGAGSTGAKIQSNSIFSNGKLGIDLGDDGVTPNDVGDTDSGPNDLQNFPVITSASGSTIRGTLSSLPNEKYRIEFFASAAKDPSGFGEGQTFLGALDNVATPATGANAGNANFTFTAATPLPAGQFITATATYVADTAGGAGGGGIGHDGDTSEFSRAVAVGSSLPTLSVGDASVNEGQTAQFTLTLSAASNAPVSVTFHTVNNEAAAPGDFTAVNKLVTIPAGQTTATVNVPTIDDNIDENNELFTVALTNPSGATLARAEGVGTIVNNDTSVVSINDVSMTEGNSGTKDFVFTVSLSNPSAQTETVQFITLDGTAKAGSDYVTLNAFVTFAPGQTAQTLTVKVKGDTVAEPDENFFVTTAPPPPPSERIRSHLVGGDTFGVGTIVNDDAGTLPPTLSVNNAAVHEGQPARFTLTLSQISNSPVSVRFRTIDQTAEAPGDFTAVNRIVTIPAGQLSTTVDVPTIDDNIDEFNEFFFVALTAPQGATLDRDQGNGTIFDDDTSVVSINDLSSAEGNSGTKNFTFTVKLSNPNVAQIIVDFATQNGTASAASDYIAQSGTLNFAPGETTKTIRVQVRGDTLVEPDETFRVRLTQTEDDGEGDVTVTQLASAKGTIVNDDSVAQRADLEVTQTVNPTAVAVGQTATFTITVSNNGPANATSVILNDTLPSGAQLILATPAAASNQNGALRFNLGTLNVGQSRVITVKLRLNTPGQAINNAVASSPISDPVQANNTASATTPVGPLDATPQITITASSFSPIGGYIPGLFTPRRVAQILTLRNNGTALRGPISLLLGNLSSNAKLTNAAGKTTTAQAPAGRPYVAVSAGSDNILNSGESATVRLEFSVSGNGNPTYTTTVIAGAGAR